MRPASGRQDHTTSRSASSALVCSAISVHRIQLHVRDNCETPLWRSGTARVLNLIWGIREAIFLQQGLDSFGVRGLICPSGSHIAVTQRAVSPPRHCEEQRNEAVHSFVPAVRMDWLRGACYRARICATPHSPWLYPTPYSNRSALQPLRYLSMLNLSNRRTVVWEGRSCETPPYPDRNDAENWNAMYCICGQRGAAPTRSQRLAMNVCDSKWV